MLKPTPRAPSMTPERAGAILAGARDALDRAPALLADTQRRIDAIDPELPPGVRTERTIALRREAAPNADDLGNEVFADLQALAGSSIAGIRAAALRHARFDADPERDGRLREALAQRALRVALPDLLALVQDVAQRPPAPDAVARVGTLSEVVEAHRRAEQSRSARPRAHIDQRLPRSGGHGSTRRRVGSASHAGGAS